MRQFPEFAPAGRLLIQVTYDAALLSCDAEFWGSLREQAAFYLTAHKLALSPSGQAARMQAKDGVTTYLTHYRHLLSAQPTGYRVP